ncbi:hypothetical protein KC345_g8984, partial [Hortaea werneckii]
VQEGERELFSYIVDVYQQPVYRYCCRMLGNRQDAEDAEDAVQDVLVKAYQSIRGYKPTVSFQAWLYRIACNHCLNLLRRRRMQGHFLRLFRPETAVAGPEQKLEECLYSPVLAAALGRLSPEERNLLVLRVFEEQTFLEISAILNISPNALHKRMERIKRIGNEYQDIKAAAAGEEQLPRIEVTGRVMSRIRGLEQKRGLNGIRFAAYAASEYIQIRNKEGVVKVQHYAPDLKPQGTAPYYKYAWKLMDFAKPGELIAYFVRGEKLPEEAESALQFTGKELRLTDYPAFLGEMNKLKTPVLPKEAGGYVLKYGTIYPASPTDKEYGENPLYRQTLNELIAEARQDTGRNLFMKAIPWTEAASVSGKYTKQGAVIEIGVTLLHGGGMQVFQEPESKVEKLKAEGREIIYNFVSRPDIKPDLSYHYLNWYNERQDAYYTVTTYGDRQLTKEQLLDLAGELIKGGL